MTTHDPYPDTPPPGRTRQAAAAELLWAVAGRPGPPTVSEALDQWVEVVGYAPGDLVTVTLPSGGIYTAVILEEGSETVWGLGFWVKSTPASPRRFAPRRWTRPVLRDACTRAFDVIEEAEEVAACS